MNRGIELDLPSIHSRNSRHNEKPIERGGEKRTKNNKKKKQLLDAFIWWKTFTSTGNEDVSNLEKKHICGWKEEKVERGGVQRLLFILSNN